MEPDLIDFDDGYGPIVPGDGWGEPHEPRPDTRGDEPHEETHPSNRRRTAVTQLSSQP